MSVDAIRLACLEVALKCEKNRAPLDETIDMLARFVSDSPIKLGCLKIAAEQYGRSLRTGVADPGGLIGFAQEYYNAVKPKVEPVSVKVVAPRKVRKPKA